MEVKGGGSNWQTDPFLILFLINGIKPNRKKHIDGLLLPQEKVNVFWSAPQVSAKKVLPVPDACCLLAGRTPQAVYSSRCPMAEKPILLNAADWLL